MIFGRRKRRKYLPSPPAPDPERLREAQEAARSAHTQLENAQANDDEVDERSEHLKGVLTSNNLGPKFWAAVAARRPQ